MGQNDRAANLLIGVTAVNAQLHMHFHRLVKLGLAGFDGDIQRFVHIIESCAVEQLGAVDIFLTVFHSHILPVEW